MSARCLMRAIALAALPLSVVAEPAPGILPVHVYSDVIAAEVCLQRGFPWIVRLGPHDELCLASAIGVAKRAVRAQDVIDAAVRQVRTK